MRKLRPLPRMPYKGPVQSGVLYVLWIITASFLFALASQMVVNFDPEAFFAIGFKKIVLEMVITAGVCALFYLLTGKLNLSLIIGTALLMILSLVSSYVFVFRGTELMPLDFASAGTAANVAGEYHFFLTPLMAEGLLLWMIALLPGFFLPKRKEPEGMKGHLQRRGIALGLLLVLLLFWDMGSSGIYIETWANNGSKYSGFLLNFTLQMKSELASSRPAGYSPEQVQKLEEKYPSESADASALQYPDVILILEESFADFEKLGEKPDTAETITPYWDSLGENANKGYALSSVFGGGTANSEYEVLTGNTMGFLSPGATPYQLYLHQKSYAMPSYLRSLGYSCHATHPYLASGWNRPKIYPLLGFDDCSFLDSYPQKKLIRDYISDEEMFDSLIDRYEKRDPSRPFFLFGITMQNHGGYDYVGSGVTPKMTIRDSQGEFPKAEQYLGLIHESDRAMKKLFDYFSKTERPTVIAIFGDHYPWVEVEYYEKLHGGAFETLDEQEREYSVPFVVWANYDIPEKRTSLTSLSYLSAMIYDAAKIPQPPYNRFLKDMSECIPAWNSQGYYSKIKKGFEYYKNAEGEEKEWLDRYSYLQYNSLFEGNKRSSHFFPVD